MDRRGPVRVYLEIEKSKAANLCLQGKPRGSGQDREVTCQVSHSPQSYPCKKEGRIVPAKDMESFTEHFVSKPSIPVTMQSTLDCCHGNRQLGV